MPIVLDAMGSDDRPEPELRAAIEASRLFNEEIILVGDEAVLKPRLAVMDLSGARVSVVHAPEAIDMQDHIEDARKKRQNTMKVGMDLVKTGQAQAFVTAGNTGMVMYHAIKAFGYLPHVIRPALTALFPVNGGHAVVIDIGANAECRPEFLLQFGVMGSVYAERILGKVNPRVGLLANGEEAGKGNELVKGTYPLLAASGLNFIGNVEGKEVFGGKSDVVVTDGFTGNVMLKTSEAVARLLVDVLKDNLMSSLRTKIGAALAKPAFGAIRKMMDPAETGAAPLLGVNGLVLIGHGRSDARALVSAIRVAKQALDADLLNALTAAIQTRLSTAPENPAQRS